MSPVPLYHTAATMLEELAKPLFRRSMTAPANSHAAEEAGEAWYSLRAIAGRIACTKSINLSARDERVMNKALELLHDMDHNTDLEHPRAADCKCLVALCIGALRGVLEAYKKQFPGGSYAA